MKKSPAQKAELGFYAGTTHLMKKYLWICALSSMLLCAVLWIVYSLRCDIIHHFLYCHSQHVLNLSPENSNYENADLIIYSYDRPLQLYALLESTEKHVKGIGETHVIYRSSTDAYDKGYKVVKARFPYAVFHKQGSTPCSDFQLKTISCVKNSPSDFVIFAVDDIIVTSDFDIQQCVKYMKKNRAYAFLFRLGCNINGLKMDIPMHDKLENQMLLWVVKNGKQLWRYVHNVDFTLYNKGEILPALEQLTFSAPNTMEEAWNRLLFVKVLNGLKPWSLENFKRVMCLNQSKIINIPLNLVNEEINNRHLDGFPKEKLLKMFEEGYRIDVDKYFHFLTDQAHVYIIPAFIIP